MADAAIYKFFASHNYLIPDLNHIYLFSNLQ